MGLSTKDMCVISMSKVIHQERRKKKKKRSSKTFAVLWNTSKAILNKWRKLGHPDQGHYQKQDIALYKKKKRLMDKKKEAAKRLMATLEELQEYLARTDHALHVTTISHNLHARQKPFLTK